MNLLFNILVTYLTLATAAEAGPVGVAIGAIVGKLTVAKVAAIVLLSVASSVVQTTLMKMKAKKQRQPGIQTERTAQGGVNSRTIMVGLYATAGAEVCPPMSHGRAGFKTPNCFLTYVISLADLPVHALTRLVMNGEYVPIDRTPGAGGWKGAAYGFPIGGKYNDRAWIRFHDGRQTAADAMLLQYYGNYPDRPWTANHVGIGCAYAIVTVQYDTERFKGEPTFKFEVQGSRFYDPRKDSTVGGSGAHRWGNAATYEFTLNPDVIKYNILRGITLADGSKWGGECTAEDLPLANWVAAMNVCDEIVDGEPRYRCGFEIKVGEDQPADVIEELNKASSSEIVEIGGVYKIRTGGPGLPVMFISDRDILVSEEQTEDPFPSYNEAKNTIYATFPHPGEQWAAHDAPRRQVAEYLAADNGVENAEEMNLAAVPFPKQVQRNVLAWLKDNRRFRQHTGSIGFYAWGIEPLDVIEYTSEKRGYVNKDFDIDETAEDLLTLKNALKMREVDPGDYNWQPSFELPDPVAPGGWQLPDSTTLEDFAVVPYALADSDGDARRPALYVSWDGQNMDDVRSVSIEQTHIASGEVTNKSVSDVASGGTFLTDVVAGEAYSVRGKPEADRATTWTDPVQATAPDVKVGQKDIAETVYEEFREIAQRAGVEPVDNLPTTGRPNQIVMKLPEGRLYRWDTTLNGGAGGWSENLYAGVAPGSLDRTKFAQGIEPVSVITGSVLPTVKTTETIVFGGKLYRWNGTAYTAAVPTTDLTGTIGNAQIADNAVTQAKIMNGSLNAAKFATGLEPVSVSTAGTLPTTKTTATLVWGGKLYRWNGTQYVASVAAVDLTGQITGTQITDGAVTTDKLGANSVTAGKILAGSIDTDKLAANAVTAAKIMAGAVGADQIAANAVNVKHLVVSDWENLIPNGSLEIDDISSWTQPSNGRFYTVTSVTQTGERAYILQKDAVGGTSVSTRFNNDRVIPVRPNEVLYAETSLRTNEASAPQGAYYRIEWLNADKVLLASPNNYTDIANNVPITSVWTVYGKQIVVPPGAAFARPQLYNHSTNTVNRNLIFDRLLLRRAANAELIVDGAITTDKLAANSVTAGKIVAGSIDTDKLAAGAVTALKIEANAVTADKIAANAVTAAKIQAGAVGADQIAANAVTAKHLLISDFTNLLTNSEFAGGNADGWTIPSGVSVGTMPGNSAAQYGLIFAQDASSLVRWGPAIVAKAGDQFYFSARIRASGDAGRRFTARARVSFQDRNGAELSAGTIAQVTNTSTSFIDMTGDGTVPNNADIAQIRVSLHRSADASESQTGYLENPTLRRKNAGELIVDGAITANKLAANSVTANAIVAGTITATELASGSVTTIKLASLAVTTDKLEANAITAAKIASDAIEARHIKAKAITAEAMAANSITATNGAIANLAVDTLQLAGNAVTVTAFAANEGSEQTRGTARPTLVSVTLNRVAGYSTALNVCLRFSVPQNTGMTIYIYRNSTLIKTFMASPQGLSPNEGGTVARMLIDDNTSGGSTTYSVQAQQFWSGGGGSVESSGSVADGFISATQFKR